MRKNRKDILIIELPPPPPPYVVQIEDFRPSSAEQYDGLWIVRGDKQPPEPPDHHHNDHIEENPPSGRSVSVSDTLSVTDADAATVTIQ